MLGGEIEPEAMKSRIIAFVTTLITVGAAYAAESPILGQLGKPVGSELTIEGRFQVGKDIWVLVERVDGERLSRPVLIETDNLDPFARIPTNTVCRLKGKELTWVVRDTIDPKTGRPGQQKLAGRHFAFMVTKVIAPKGVKTRDEK